MNWIYLSPHLDDVALSCGGLVWEQTSAGEPVSVWTICAGDPPEGPLSTFAESFHQRWDTGLAASSARRQEDIASCERLGASHRHFPVPDCIYRLAPGDGIHLYTSEEALFGSLDPREASLVQSLADDLGQAIPPQANLVCPLTLGGHVDHRLVRAAAEGLGQPLWYYADYPYVEKAAGQLAELRQQGWEQAIFPISEHGLQAWEQAVAAHASQISTFWPGLDAMQAALRAYYRQMGGAILWKPPAGRLLHR